MHPLFAGYHNDVRRTLTRAVRCAYHCADMRSDSQLIDVLGGATAVARRLGIKAPSVHEWRTRGIPLDKRILLAHDIERATGGEVTRIDLLPGDWHRIWPELVGTEGAPPVPDPQPEKAAA